VKTWQQQQQQSLLSRGLSFEMEPSASSLMTADESVAVAGGGR